MELKVLAKADIMGQESTLTRMGWMCSDPKLEDVLNWYAEHPPFIHSPIWWKDLTEAMVSKFGGKVNYIYEEPGK